MTKVLTLSPSGKLEEIDISTSDIVSQPKEQKLVNWFTKMNNSPSTATLAFVGDSTSDLTGNAIWLIAEIERYIEVGSPLEGFTTANMPNYGSNGQTITGFIIDAGVKGLAALIAANLDLIIFSYGINDIRQNFLTKDQLKTEIITCIEAIKAGSPDTSIVLRMPNSFDVPTTDFYIKQGAYASLAEAAQAQSAILYTAYKELEFYWDDVLLFNSQDLIFGRISSPTTPSFLHSDEIHPEYSIITKLLVENFIGYKKLFKKDVAIYATGYNYASPWDQYPRVFELESDYIKLGEGQTNAHGASYNFFSVEPYTAYDLASGYRYGDYISFAWGDLIVLNLNSLDFNNESRVNYPVTLPANTYPNGTIVEFFRSKYNNQEINKTYLNDKTNYPYARRVKIGYASSGAFLIADLLDDDIITPITPGITAGTLEMTTDDIVVFNDGTVLTLTGATFSLFFGGTLVTIGGSYSTYADTVAFLYSNRPYESVQQGLSFSQLYSSSTLNL